MTFPPAPFAALSFPSTGTLTPRALGDRFADITNVKDDDAKGDGVTDDWAAIMRAYNHGQISLVTTASNLTASFTGQIAFATFTGTISGNTLTINSGLSGTVVAGQTVVTSAGNRVIASGSGTTWTTSGAPLSVGPAAMSTNAVLVASSVVGTIAMGNAVLGAGVSGMSVQAQQTGTTGSDGVYVMPAAANVGPEAMTTVGGVLTFASVPNPTTLGGRYLNDVTTPGAFDPVFVPTVSSATSTTITYTQVVGLVHAGDTITVNLAAKGIVEFPLGTYIVSQPIDFGDPNLANVIFRGPPGTTVIGNFPEYVFKRAVPDTSGHSGYIAVEGLTVINLHPNGGGIRIGYTVGGAVRDCIVIANHGINTASDDTIAGVTSQEMAIKNCYLSPGANPSGSIGIMSVSDGPIANCRVVGFDKGIITWGQQGGMIILGGTIELCGIGLQPGVRPGGGGDAGSGMQIFGTRFKDCGEAISATVGSTGDAIFEGVVIEATEGTIAGDPQYGMRLDKVGSSLFLGVRVIGQYAQYAIEILGGEVTTPADNWMIGVQAFNTSSLVRPAWKLPPTAGTVHFVNCNVAPVFSVAHLPAYPLPISSITWSAGTMTAVVIGNVNPLMGSPLTVTVFGISPSGFDGTFSGVTVVSSNTLTWPQANPGAGSGTGSGTALINLVPVASAAAANEGDCYNVSDSDASAWRANPSATPGSTHAKVRWSGSNWAVMGQ